jgi:hypothetical protein
MRIRRVASVAAAVIMTAGGLSLAAPVADASDDGVVLRWFDATSATVSTAGSPVQAPSSALWATAWLAGDRAVAAGRARSGPYAAGAFAQAIHDVLVARVPAAAANLDATLASTLDSVPGGARRDAAVRTGQRAAASVLAERAGDGLDVAAVNQPYEPVGGAGHWTPTTVGKTAIQSALGQARPYRLRSGGQFTVPEPPALGSAAYRADLAEVRAYGAAEGSARTAEQTEVALFWEQSSLSAYTQVLRAAVGQVARRHGTVAEQVHLVAVFHEVTTDAQIAVFHAKYLHQRWRPLTAIREAALDGTPLSDGDPLTVPDPAWNSLFAAPSHPEYPSGHTGYAGAAAVVLDALAGPPNAPVAVTSPTAPGVTRTYTDWHTLVQENVDGRVWEGVHFRTSDLAAARLGKVVAWYGLRAAR